MKFQFKIQPYQTDAVNSVVNIFSGQSYQERIRYVRDIGILKEEKPPKQIKLFAEPENVADENRVGFENADLQLTDEQLLFNIRNMQVRNNIMQSESLVKHIGRCSLDVEMETGTGKTYVYIKTMFELNKLYGWSKFIVVVPSIAIREGVKKSFEIMQEHFMENYGKKARYFIYNSKNLNDLDNFSSNPGINVMIINVQAFNARGADARRIYETLDNFGTRKPIDVIKANRPIVILDEPQKMGGDKTQAALAEFNPLFCLNYSATHQQHHNLVYVLDALDAYNKRLVKKIEVKGFEVKNLRGTDHYLFLENIIISPKKPPMAKIELEISYQKSINRESRILGVDDDLYVISKNMEQYKGYLISEIDPIRGIVTFTNGETISRGEVVGDVTEKDMRRIQIRETIISHFEKEKRNFELGIKTLSLFFIDEVAKYRVYDAEGNEINSEYGSIFEQEYVSILNDFITNEDTPYVRYLKEKCSDETKVHTGYFSIDNKGRKTDSSVKRGSDESDDTSAYDLILKEKEQLLSFNEPVRFIFSHSALREGWDNPNVFQICTLKHSDSTTQKRQEVGRGLRLAVNQNGDRMDELFCGSSVHDINLLTVIASESYRQFVTDLQKKIKEDLYNRPTRATQEYFIGKTILVGETPVVLDAKRAKDIYRYLLKNDYIDDNDNITDIYRADQQNQCLAPLPETLVPMTEGIHLLVQSVFDDSVLKDMVTNGNQTKIVENALNENFYKKEFQALWGYINHQYAYTVEFDSTELIEKAIKHMNEKMFVTRLQYTVTVGRQNQDIDENALGRGDSFTSEKNRTETIQNAGGSQIKYDLIGKIAEGATLTRRTTAAILAGLEKSVFAMFRHNPEEFISKAIRLIKEQKATVIVEHISYNRTEDCYDSSIFTSEKSGDFTKALRAHKHIQDYVFTDGTAEKSIERQFAEDMERAEEVCVYAKLPKGFSIPTPVGNYSPDWAIAFNAGTVKHIFFIAETKGTMDSLNLRPIEQAKIACAKRLFNKLSSENVKYHDVDSYQSLLNIMEKIQ
ncbi:type III restriction-modification system endonuclease [Paenibacillus chitinolyticus]|uniref:type III restriction-modification system endonuclease n=1 Tax=Paenibacillus chitinolyticus TaxID=79263 RepID=UPI0035DC43E5